MGQAVAQRAGSNFAGVIAAALAAGFAVPASAADYSAPLVTKAAPVPEVGYFAPQPVPAYQLDFATRYWYGISKTSKNLYGSPGLSNDLFSRLTYSNLNTHSGELFGRVGFTNGWFVKGYVGTGVKARGTLTDEDFPPVVDPYSSTVSDQHNGYLTYASADIGYNIVRGGDFRVGLFAGYHYFNEQENAYGCTQSAGNPDVCAGAIPSSIPVITQNNKWNSVRLGLDGTVLLGDHFKFSAEGAWLPYVRLSGNDAHWLRIGTDPGDFVGPVSEDGNGWGYQFEALLSYQVTQYASIGVGGRYWHMQTKGDTHFENAFVGGGGSPDPVNWKTDVYGVFVQAGFKFGPYPIGLH
jgi:outer membrane protease